MKYALKEILAILTIILLFSSCKNTDPFKKQSELSSINQAYDFLSEYENPKSKKGIKRCYNRILSESQNEMSYDKFEEWILQRFPQGHIYRIKTEIDLWEKYELKDGSVIVYLLKKSKFNAFFRRFNEYEIIRILLEKENDIWKVKIENASNFNGINPIAKGDYQSLNEEEITFLKNTIKSDVENYQFKLEVKNIQTSEEILAEKCIEEGEKLYDMEEYRKALMQFQKALSISPLNQKASVYIERCKKAISLKLGK